MYMSVRMKQTIQRQCCFPQTSTSVDIRSGRMSSQAVPTITERQYVNIHFKIPFRSTQQDSLRKTDWAEGMMTPSQNYISMYKGSSYTSTYKPLWSIKRRHITYAASAGPNENTLRKKDFRKQNPLQKNHWKISLPSVTVII